MLRRLLAMMFRSTLYLMIHENRMVLRDVERGAQADVSAAEAFTSTRLLVGDFIAAEHCLQACVRTLGTRSWLARPKVVVHPMTRIEGGLSAVEGRCLIELIDVALRPADTRIWVGDVLRDDQVRDAVSAPRSDAASG